MVNRRRTAREREVYFRGICNQIAKRLQIAGISQAEIDRQLRAFTETVNRCISEGWNFPSSNPDTVSVHRDQRMGDIFDDNKHPPGAA